MVRMMLDEEMVDTEFCAEFVTGVDELRAAVEPFTLDYVAARTAWPAATSRPQPRCSLLGPRGTVSSATGPDMGPHGNITEHLIASINALCGRVNRAGDVHETLALLMPDLPAIAAVVPRAFMPDNINPAANTLRSRLHGAHQLYQEMPTSTLADEILTSGDGQIRALIVVGGNPMTSWPDNDKTRRALEDLDLLVCIDVRHTDTVELADYVPPASYGLERPEMTAYNDYLYNQPFVQFADRVIDPPGDAREEWVYLAELAQRLGTPIELAGGPLGLLDAESSSGIFAKLYPEGSTRIPLDDIVSHDGGKVYDQYSNVQVIPKFEGMDDRFNVFRRRRGRRDRPASRPRRRHRGRLRTRRAFTHLMICRRNGKVYNSMVHEVPKTADGNPVQLHPDDLAAMDARPGDVMRLRSEHGAIDVVVDTDPTLRRGVVSVSHGFGGRVVGEGDVASRRCRSC